MIVQLFQTVGVIVAIQAANDSPSKVGIVPPAGRFLYQKFAESRLEGWEIEKSKQVEGFAPALVALAEDLIKRKADFEHVYFVLDALRARDDLGEEDLAWVRSKLEPLLGKNEGSLGDVVKDRCLSILSKYPGEENEKVLIEFLKDEKEGDNEFGYSSVAAAGLQGVGTFRSVGPLKEYVEKLKSIPGVDPDGSTFVELVDLIKKLELRASESATGSPTDGGEPAAFAPNGAVPTTDAARTSSENVHSMTSGSRDHFSFSMSKWQVAAVMCLSVALVCLWVLRRR